MANDPIPDTIPRSVCQSGSGGQCCVSWSDYPQNGQYDYLVHAGFTVNNQCQDNGMVSGWVNDVLIGSSCMVQCLSDRPNGCS